VEINKTLFFHLYTLAKYTACGTMVSLCPSIMAGGNKPDEIASLTATEEITVPISESYEEIRSPITPTMDSPIETHTDEQETKIRTHRRRKKKKKGSATLASAPGEIATTGDSSDIAPLSREAIIREEIKRRLMEQEIEEITLNAAAYKKICTQQLLSIMVKSGYCTMLRFFQEVESLQQTIHSLRAAFSRDIKKKIKKLLKIKFLCHEITKRARNMRNAPNYHIASIIIHTHEPQSDDMQLRQRIAQDCNEHAGIEGLALTADNFQLDTETNNLSYIPHTAEAHAFVIRFYGGSTEDKLRYYEQDNTALPGIRFIAQMLLLSMHLHQLYITIAQLSTTMADDCSEEAYTTQIPYGSILSEQANIIFRNCNPGQIYKCIPLLLNQDSDINTTIARLDSIRIHMPSADWYNSMHAKLSEAALQGMDTVTEMQLLCGTIPHLARKKGLSIHKQITQVPHEFAQQMHKFIQLDQDLLATHCGVTLDLQTILQRDLSREREEKVAAKQASDAARKFLLESCPSTSVGRSKKRNKQTQPPASTAEEDSTTRHADQQHDEVKPTTHSERRIKQHVPSRGQLIPVERQQARKATFPLLYHQRFAPWFAIAIKGIEASADEQHYLQEQGYTPSTDSILYHAYSPLVDRFLLRLGWQGHIERDNKRYRCRAMRGEVQHADGTRLPTLFSISLPEGEPNKKPLIIHRECRPLRGTHAHSLIAWRADQWQEQVASHDASPPTKATHGRTFRTSGTDPIEQACQQALAIQENENDLVIRIPDEQLKCEYILYKQ